MGTFPASAGRRPWFCLPAIAFAAGTAAAQTEPAKPPAPAPAKPAPAVQGGPLDHIAENQVVAVLGLAANGVDGKPIGRIVDVLVDKMGRPRAAVIEVGGFLGVGNRKVAVDWAAVHFVLGKEAEARLPIPSSDIKAAPAYDPAKPVQAIGMPEPKPAPKPAVAAPAAKP